VLGSLTALSRSCGVLPVGFDLQLLADGGELLPDGEQRAAEALDLLRREIAGLDATDCLAFKQLAHRLSQGEYERCEAAPDVVRVEVNA